jgi:putative CocE/NonD family hydrolase
MSDGVTLVGNVYYPSNLKTGQRASGKFPVILVQNPYDSGPSSEDTTTPNYLVPRGYIYVTVDVRGTGPSDGTYDLLSPRNQQDSVELVNWCAHQLSGSNGIVGLDGGSQLGEIQYFTAAQVGPHSPLKAIFPSYASADFYRELFFGGGIPTVFGPSLAQEIADYAKGNWGTTFNDSISSGGDLAYEGQYWLQR